MATRQRTPSRHSDAREKEDDLLAYETMFDLDNDITEDDVEEFLEEQEVEDELKEKKGSFLNLQTGSGLAIIAIGTIYLLDYLGFLALRFNMGEFVALLPLLAGILIIMSGFGVLSWSPSRRRRRARRKARERRAHRQRMEKTLGRAGTHKQRTSSTAFEEAKVAVQRASREAGRAVGGARARASQRRTGTRKRLAKSRTHKVVSGVAGGIANYLGIDPLLVRIAFVIGTIVGQGAMIPLYIILAFVLPAAEAMDKEDDDPIVKIVQD